MGRQRTALSARRAPDRGDARGDADEATALRLAFVGLTADETAAHAQVVLDWTDGIARLARFAIAPSFRGQGLARPFLADVFARLNEVGDFPRLELNVYTFNTPAIALYESLGFVREGVRRSSVKVGTARWDTAIYAIIRDS